MRRKRSASALGLLAAAITAVRAELEARGIGFIVIRPNGEGAGWVEVFAPDAKPTDVTPPTKLQRVIDALVRSGGSEAGREYCINVEARITHVNLR